MKRLLTLLCTLLFMVPALVLASVSSTTYWSVRTDGSDSNAGGFDASVASPGTDYSNQAAAQVTYTDIVLATSTTCTSAANPFTSAHVGNTLRITSGTGFTAGFYTITAVSGGVATLSSSAGTAGSTGGNGKLGGAFATVSMSMSTGAAATGGGAGAYVADGTYAENTSSGGSLRSLYSYASTFTVRARTLNSTGVIVTGTSATSNLLFTSAPTTNLTFQDIVFKARSGSTYIVECSSATAAMTNVVFTRCTFDANSDASLTTGFRMNAGNSAAITQSVTFNQCTWSMSTAPSTATGILMQGNNAGPYVVACTFNGCTGTFPGRGIWVVGGTANINGGRFVGTGTLCTIYYGQDQGSATGNVVNGTMTGAYASSAGSHCVLVGAGAQSVALTKNIILGGNHGVVVKGSARNTTIRNNWMVGNGSGTTNEYGLFNKGSYGLTATANVIGAGASTYAAISNSDGNPAYQCQNTTIKGNLVYSHRSGDIYTWKTANEMRYTITGATNATPIVIATQESHDASAYDGQTVTISGVEGNTAANGTFYVKYTGQDANHFALYSDSSLSTPVAGTGTYTSGGTISPNTIIDLNYYEFRGSGRYGEVLGSTSISTLAGVTAAWASGATGTQALNDANSGASNLDPSFKLPLFQYWGTASQTLYMVITDPSGRAWTGTAWEPFDSANWLSYAIPLFEDKSGSGHYVWPIQLDLPAGQICPRIYSTSSWGTQAYTDSYVATQTYEWTGPASTSTLSGLMIQLRNLLGLIKR